MAPSQKSRRKLELIDHGDEPLIDHKGRAKPLYKRRSGPKPKVPKQWRPGRWGKLLLGLFPGARLMFLESMSGGLPYAIIGMLALLAAVLIGTRLGVTAETLRILAIKPQVFLLHAVALVVAVALYELARLGASLEEQSDKPTAARMAAALLLPAAVVVFGAPKVISLHPRLVEASWLAAMVLLLGAVPAAVRCLFAFDRVIENPRGRLLVPLLTVLLLVAAIGTVLGVADARRAVASAAASAGFEILPKLLS